MESISIAADGYYKDVLSWDLFFMLSGKAMYHLRSVPVRFSSVDEYFDIFEPLLLEECRAQTLRSFHESDGCGHLLKLLAVEPLEPFRIAHFKAPPGNSMKPVFFDTDLVFVSHEPLDLAAHVGAGNGGSEEGEKHSTQMRGQQFHALALVSTSPPGALSLKLYLPEEPTCRLPPSQHKRLQMLRKVMVPASGNWWVRKLGNMVTINREFQALYSVRELALAAKLLAPGGPEATALPSSLQPPTTLLSAIEKSHNPSQLLAIRTCLRGRGVTLIQGPPGTGKTKTILGILSVLLACESRLGRTGARCHEGEARTPTWPSARPVRSPTCDVRSLLDVAMPWLHAGSVDSGPQIGTACGAGNVHPFPTADKIGEQLQLGHTSIDAPPKHVLVCAPSNAAIDEIVSRLLRHSGVGMLNSKGESFIPLVVRVGPNIKESLLEVALDTLAKRRQAEHSDALTYDVAKMQVLNEAAIVCTTLSCAGYSMFSQLKQGFDTVLIDEAAQAVEMSTLIPLKYACRRLILVGDPNQLPATVFSDNAMKHNYEQSLFQRLQIDGQRVAMLTTQYRMHPHISRFPGRRFYDGALKDAPNMAEQNRAPWHEKRCFGPYVFYDVDDGVASEVASSWTNELEAQLAVHLVRQLLEAYAEHVQPASIGVISPYNAQVRALRRLFAEALGAERAAEIEVNSVDGFQGREKDVVVLSSVRSDRGRENAIRGIGFLRDARRMNVSITRARASVFVIGHVATLKEEPLWEAMIHDAAERRCLLRAHSPIAIWFAQACQEQSVEEPHDGGAVDGEPATLVGTSSAPVVAKCSPTPRSRRSTKRTSSAASGEAEVDWTLLAS